MKTIDVRIIWDKEAKVYVAVGDKIGLVLESESYDRLLERVRTSAPEMMELNHISGYNEVRIRTAERMLPLFEKEDWLQKDNEDEK